MTEGDASMTIQPANLKRLYGSNACARAILDHLAADGEDRDETTVHEMWTLLVSRAHSFSRHHVIRAFKSLQHVGAGVFLVGRKGHPTRFVHVVSVRELAKLARGEQEPVPVPRSSDVAPPPATPAAEHAATLTHRYNLRPDLLIELALPADLTKSEATRLAEFVRTLPFG
jgi:hypothetical protein